MGGYVARDLQTDEAVLREQFRRFGLPSVPIDARLSVVELTLPDGVAPDVLLAAAADEGVGARQCAAAVLLWGSVGSLRRLGDRLVRGDAGASRVLLDVVDPRPPERLTARGRTLPLGRRTLVMGILNLSEDSFSGDGLRDRAAAVAQAERFLAAGADMLDVGAMSTQPGSEPISEEEEAGRLSEVIAAVRPLSRGMVSADTYRVEPARAALDAGADIVNDVTGLRDPAMAPLAAEYGAGVVVMHMLGTPATMQREPRYEDVVGEVYRSLADGAVRAREAGVPPEGIVVDPGIGFGKTLSHNLELLRRLPEFRSLGRALLVGTSRKSFIGKVTGREVDDRVEGTAATVALSIAGGADIVRVHDAEAMATVARMSDAVVRRDWEPAAREADA